MPVYGLTLPQRHLNAKYQWLIRAADICSILLEVNNLSSLGYAGYILALIGGIIIVISGIFSVIGTPLFAYTVLGAVGAFFSGIVQLILGIICIVRSKWVRSLTWAIILLVLGVIAGGIGGVLVAVGAILGLIDQIDQFA